MKRISAAALTALCFFSMGASSVKATSEIIPLDLPSAPIIVKQTDERAMLGDVNAARNHEGETPLVRDEKLNAIARLHARDMIARHYFGHETPDGQTFDERFRLAGAPYRYAGENIAEISDEHEAHKALMASPEHRDNILESNYRKIGIAAISVGDYTTFYVQEFSD
jgi:uncharacterized protein YkwD